MLKHRHGASLELTAQERGDLEAVVASRSPRHGLVRRAHMILLTESGVSIRETARRVKVTPPAVTNWRKRFRKQRLTGLHNQLKSGRPRKHSEEDVAVLLNAALARRPSPETIYVERNCRLDPGQTRAPW
jgi:transposase-like protein